MNLIRIIKIQDKLILNYTIQTQNQTNIISKLEKKSEINQNKEDFKAETAHIERNRDVLTKFDQNFQNESELKLKYPKYLKFKLLIVCFSSNSMFFYGCCI